LAVALAKQDSNRTITVFLLADAVSCAKKGQKTPDGYYNIERMLKGLASKGVKIGICGSCMDARGIKPDSVTEGPKRSSLDELTAWTQEADKILVF
jgi:uncharacterized protein involved in oxidation of intracellular sulfur